MVQLPPVAPPGHSAGDARAASRQLGGVLRMVRWTDRGPYRLDLDSMLDQARAAVLARPDLLAQLDMLQDPPDLTAVVTSQRELILAGVRGLESRANKTAFKLRDLLFASLLSDPDQSEETGFLAASILSLGAMIEALRTWNRETLDRLPAAEVIARAETLRQIDQARSQIAATWGQRYGGDALKLAALEQGSVTPSPAASRTFTNDPAVRTAMLERELAICGALDGDLRNQLELKLTERVAVARENRDNRAAETEWESQQREAQAALGKAVLAAALTALNEAVSAATAPRMRAAFLDGLRSALTDDKVVATAAFGQLASKLRERSEGSFGIAGPRGVGKTTLIKFQAAGLGLLPPDNAEATARKPRLGVVVSAPVRYQAKDFVLYLYAELCKKVIGPDADEALRDKVYDLDWQTRPSSWLNWRAWAMGAATAGAAAVTGGAVLLGWAIRHAASAGVHVLAYIAAGLLASAGLVLLVVLGRLAGAARIAVPVGFMEAELTGPAGEDGSGEDEQSGRGSSGLGSYPDVPAGRASRPLPIISRALPRYTIWSSQYTAAAIVGGIALLLTGGGWPGGSWPLAGGITALTIGVGCLRFSRLARQVQPWGTLVFPSLGLDLRALESGGPISTRLRELALETLTQIRIQQSFASERTRVASVSGPSVLPAKVELDLKRGVTWTEREKSYPELVADVKTFLGAVAEEYEVVIGIDELDKLRTADSVEDFLNDIKGIFGVPGCYYLVSVSEDAAAGFERRGAPFRDVFDSSFDDVISLRPLDLVSARKILHGLLLGWTEPFIGLCFVLSGGLPRDLWRVTHELVAQRDTSDEIEIGQAALALCRREGEARLRAVRHELTRDSLDPQKAELLQLIAGIRFTDATASDMLRWHEELRNWATGPGAAAVGQDLPTSATEEPKLRDQSAAPVIPPYLATPAARLALETAAYLLLAASVLQFFRPALIADRLGSAGADAESARAALATLASSRQALTLDPVGSLAATDRVRKEWKL